MTAAPTPSAVAVALALEELDRLKAMECLPCPAVLLARLQARNNDFHLLTGVVAAYLRSKELANG